MSNEPGTASAAAPSLSEPEDGDGFTVFVRSVSPELLAFFGRRVSPTEDAADCLGETLLVLWRRRDAFPVDRSEQRAWTYGVAHRVLKTHRRGAVRRIRLTERLRGELHVSAQFSARSDDDIAIDAFTRLSEADREVLALVIWEGFTLADAAEILGIRPATARARYSRAKSRMSGMLAAHDESTS
ncbi:RNA polymerase sigma factor [Agromyces sp. LHK192]|uniref:RNA polymerase sigma factor n=1 Tax=Agromyces sp. LHK192 TaxID=2498704 RepID=UPI000FD9C7F0|nr:sigma-70 family RNA polymerase sigma factor [Agromyces sp. LHK192]